MELSRIFIVGAGVVGCATGEGLASVGNRVTFVDTSVSRVAELRARGLDAHTELNLAVESQSAVFLTLPTPSIGYKYDLSALASGTAAVGSALAKASSVHTVVVRSTVPPGTTDGLVRPVLERCSGKPLGAGFRLAANPEFLRAATATEDFMHPRMTVIGSRDTNTLTQLTALLAPFGGQLCTFSDPASAELSKCAHNVFNATKISFWNEMWLVAQRLGIDLDSVATTVAQSAEGSTNPWYGIRGGAPFGGMCLPKDTAGFAGFADQIGVETPLLRAVIAINERMEAMMSSEVEAISAASSNATRPEVAASER